MSENYVALLGTKGGPSIRPGSSMPTSNLYVLNGKKIVVDCGLGVTKGIVDQGVQLEELSLVFITHLHSDHYLELGPMLHTAWAAGLKGKVDVYGPPGLSDYWEGFLASMKAEIDLRIEDEGRLDLRTLVAFHDVDAGVVYQQDGLAVSAIRTEHPPLVDCFAYSFKTDDVHVVCSGDTAPIAALEEMLESALPSLMKRIGNASDKLMTHWLRSHTFAHDAAKTATRAGVKRLALSHLIPSDDPDYGKTDWEIAVADHWDGPLFVGKDGLKITL